jgi:PAS domain S-box-containing protein
MTPIKMNRDFLLKYVFASLLVIMLLLVAFFYDKNYKEQHLQNTLLFVTKQISLLDLEVNQALLKSRFNLGNNDEVTEYLKKLFSNYHDLSSKITLVDQLYDKSMQSLLNNLYSRLYKKKQAIEKFRYNDYLLNQRIIKFQKSSNEIINRNDVDNKIKNKVHQLQHLVLLRFPTSKAINFLEPNAFKFLDEIAVNDNDLYSRLNNISEQARIIFAEEEKNTTELNIIIKIQEKSLEENIEQHISRYFSSKWEKKSDFQNKLFTIAMLSVLYVLYLLSSLRKKSTALESVLADVKKHQVALNEHAIVSATDVKGNITYVNSKFCEISGYSAEELLGKNHRILKSGEHPNEVYENMWQTICHGKVWHGVIKNQKKDGGFYWVNGTIVPFLNQKGKPYQYISIRTDISRQKELEKQLLDGQHFLQQVTDTMAQGLYALDKNSLCTFWNREAEHILGWTAEELLGKDLHEIIHFQDGNGKPILKENCLVDKCIRNNQIYDSDTEFFTHKDGRILPISIIAVPLLENDQTIGSVAVFSDITKRKADERIVHQAIINAQQASQAKSEFLANMSHEIRTPMNGIIGMTELTLETDLNSEQREYLEIVKDSSHALLSIVNDILDFSKIESGRLVLEHIEFDINDLIKRTLAILMPRAEQKGITLVVESTYAEQLDFLLVGDPGRLRQVLLNLVGNAIKFTLQGSIKVSVTLQEKNTHKCCLLFTVADTGIGIPEDKQEAIFDAFTQADSSVTRRFGGTGLGLSISKQFIELMAGKIWLESQPHVGTTFFFTCWFDFIQTQADIEQPLTQFSNSLNQQILLSVSTNMTETAKDDHLILNILLAEDNLINQKLAKKLLEKQGYTVQIANNGLEAVALFEQQKFDLILMDFQMPEMNGLEATTKIREIEQQQNADCRIPIIAMTANAMKEDKERAINAGMDAYVPKPINVQELLTEINRFFPTSRDQTHTVKTVIDKTVCNWETALARLGGETEILEMLSNLFLEEYISYITAIKNALDAKDGTCLQRELHTLRGVCATLGAEKLEKAIKMPENAAAQNEFAVCEAVWPAIEEDILELTRFLSSKLKGN